MHHECVGKILFRLAGTVSCKEGLRRAGDFLAEALSPYEQAHRGSCETIPALRQMNEKMEREIQRIALAVHDEAGQLLYAVHLAIATAAEASNPTVHQHLAEIGAMLHRAEQGLRRLSHELRPMILDDLGLAPALQSLAERISRTNGITIEFEGWLAALGGTLQIKSEPQRGTELLVEIPLRRTTYRSEYSPWVVSPSFARREAPSPAPQRCAQE